MAAVTMWQYKHIAFLKTSHIKFSLGFILKGIYPYVSALFCVNCKIIFRADVFSGKERTF